MNLLSVVPIEKRTCSPTFVRPNEYDQGFNQCLSLLEQFEFSEDKISKIICDEWYDQLGKNMTMGQACNLFAKAIIKNLGSVVVRKEVK